MGFSVNLVYALQKVRSVEQSFEQFNLRAFDIHLQKTYMLIEFFQIADKIDLPDFDSTLQSDVGFVGDNRTRLRTGYRVVRESAAPVEKHLPVTCAHRCVLDLHIVEISNIFLKLSMRPRVRLEGDYFF